MDQGRGEFKIFTGNANPGLARAVCEHLEQPLSHCEVGRFSDGEIQVEIAENVRGLDAFVFQPTSPPVNDHIMELLVMVDALKRASAGSITAVIPYYGYGRQDRKVAPRTPITAKLVADLLQTAGCTRVVSMDMHAGQIQGFFNIPFDHLYAGPVFQDHIRKQFPKLDEVVVVSPDAGGVERARAYSKRLGTTLAIVDKRRPKANVAEILNLIGDVAGKDALLLDDMIDTAGTICQAAQALMDKGARSVVAYAVHGVLSGPAIERIAGSALSKVVITDTIPQAAQTQATGELLAAGKLLAAGRLEVLSTARVFAEAIRRIHNFDSLSSLFV